MLWIKSFHIIAVVCWFSGLFYLPRLFVYHAMSEDQPSKDRFVIMERKLFWGITTPSMVATLALGFGYSMETGATSWPGGGCTSNWRWSQCW